MLIDTVKNICITLIEVLQLKSQIIHDIPLIGIISVLSTLVLIRKISYKMARKSF